MCLLIYVLDSVNFVMFVYLCIHYYHRFMVNKVIQNVIIRNVKSPFEILDPIKTLTKPKIKAKKLAFSR